MPMSKFCGVRRDINPKPHDYKLHIISERNIHMSKVSDANKKEYSKEKFNKSRHSDEIVKNFLIKCINFASDNSLTE